MRTEPASRESDVPVQTDTTRGSHRPVLIARRAERLSVVSISTGLLRPGDAPVLSHLRPGGARAHGRRVRGEALAPRTVRAPRDHPCDLTYVAAVGPEPCRVVSVTRPGENSRLIRDLCEHLALTALPGTVP
ncbi:hypothetical protein JCM9957A_57510 [Kineosporia succinea]